MRVKETKEKEQNAERKLEWKSRKSKKKKQQHCVYILTFLEAFNRYTHKKNK